MLRRICKDQSGSLLLLPVVALLIGLPIAVVTPHMAYIREAQEQFRSAQCIKNLLLIQENDDPSTLVCPISGLPYKSENPGGQQLMSCPDAGNHLRLGIRLIRRHELWELDPGLPDVPIPEDGVLRLEKTRTFFQFGPETLKVHHPPRSPLERYLWFPLSVVIYGVALFGPAIVILLGLLSDSEPGMWLRGGTLLRVLAMLLLLALGIFTTKELTYRAIHHQEITLSGNDKSLIVQDYYLGRAWKGPERIRSVRGVFPVFVNDRFRAMAIYEDGGRMRHRTVFQSSGADWKAVSLLNQVFVAPR